MCVRTDLRFLPLAGEAGVALVLVLWMLVLLSVIANSLVFSSRSEILVASNLASIARAEALADAGVAIAIHQLSFPANLAYPERWKADGLTRIWRFQDVDLRVNIIGESGKIDINTAAPSLLSGLFISSGINRPVAEALVDAILDWRDADSLRRLHGAEKEDYAAAGRHYGPANADFESIDELQQVMGMNNSLFARIEPFLTVYSGQPGINTAMAPREVLLAFPGSSSEQVDVFLRQRQTLLEQGLPSPPFPLAQELSSQATGSAYGIQVDVVLSDNARFIRRAVVRMAGNLADPVTVVAWRAPSGVGGEPVPDSGINKPNGQSR